MPVKRSLKLDDHFEESSFDPSRITSKRSMTEYSPTTGTCRISPFSSPTTSEKQEHRASLSCGKRSKPNHPILIRRMDSTTKENDELMMLLSKVEQSSEEIMKIMQNLRSTQALEGNRELENLIGISHAPCFLKGEVEKTKELLIKVTKQKLFVKKSSELPQKAAVARYNGQPLLCHTFSMMANIPLKTVSQSKPFPPIRCFCLGILSQQQEEHHLDSYEFLRAILN